MNGLAAKRRIWPGAVLALLAVAMLLAVAASSSWLWLGVQQSRVDALRDARFAFSAINLKSALDARLQSGGSVAELGDANVLLLQSFAAQSFIVSIDVLNRAGQIVHSTDASGLGSSAPLAWVQTCLAAPDARFDIVYAQDHWLCLPLVDGIEQVVGGLLLRYEPTGQVSAASNAAPAWPQHHLLWAWGLALALLCAAAGALAWRLCRGLHAHLSALLQTSAPQHAASHAAHALQAGLGQGQQLQLQLQACEIEVDRIDRLELH